MSAFIIQQKTNCVRYVNVLCPVDVFQVLWLTLCTALVGYVPEGDFKQRLNKYVSLMCFGILSAALSSVITYHNEENRPKSGICVANHTSPIDVLMLMCDKCYSLVGFMLCFFNVDGWFWDTKMFICSRYGVFVIIMCN